MFRPQMITFENPKSLKTNKALKCISSMLHFAPANLSGHNVCPFADSCQKSCLHYAGNPAWQGNKNRKRIERTRLFFNNRKAFWSQYISELKQQLQFAKQHNIQALHRPNGTSDIRWEYELIPDIGKTIFEYFPEIQFVDYTKWPLDQRKLVYDNYHITFSVSSSAANHKHARIAIDKYGVNVAVVFATSKYQELPKTFWGYPVIDGDLHDGRNYDQKAVVVGLRAKGKARGDISGFVHNPFTEQPIASIKEWHSLGFLRRAERKVS